ncbi:MAG: GAF domain-containing sensor histidine kinase [Chitinophagaceae bacterium]|nr:GAF domain-containing sensor histidine kinase [Chitinophagaceae bacterium]
MERIIELSELDIDYSEFQNSFKDLTKLAAKVAGTEVSLINLIDTFTQWSIANYGLPLEQMPREDSVCQYTIVAGEGQFEVKDLSADERFREKTYVTGGPRLRYYFGIPLQTSTGHNLGALCVLDKIGKEITPEKVELLKIIADEIVNRLTALKVIQNLRMRVKDSTDAQRKVAHDIRGPLGGIIGLAQIISEQGDANTMEEVLEFINLIQKSGNSLLELANEILSTDKNASSTPAELKGQESNLTTFKSKLEKLYTPQALNKQVNFQVNIVSGAEQTPFAKTKLLQIAGNLISNALKFTQVEGEVIVELSLTTGKFQNLLTIKVTDTGVGMDQATIDRIMDGTASSTDGTSGEQGFGFGLALVKHLVEGLKGSLQISSRPGEGTSFEVKLPQKRN